MLPVGIGASAGALAPVADILSGLPTSFRSPLLVCQHMPALATYSVADYLRRHAPYDIMEVDGPTPLLSDRCYVPAPGRHLLVAPTTDGFEVHASPVPRTGIYPSVDLMLAGLAECFGAGTIAVILSGMGDDGLDGCRAIARAGGRVFVQDEESSAIWGMPGAVVRAGLAELVLPLSTIPGALISATRGARRWRAA